MGVLGRFWAVAGHSLSKYFGRWKRKAVNIIEGEEMAVGLLPGVPVAHCGACTGTRTPAFHNFLGPGHRAGTREASLK